MTANERLRRLAAFAREHKIELLIIGGVDGGTAQNCALLSDFALGSTADDIVLLVRSDKIMLHASALTLEDVRARISVPADVFCNPAPVGNSLRAAMVQALPWHLLRHQPGIRVTSLLQACSEQHASSF